MDNIEQEDLALENARATMDQWQGILLTVIRELRSDPSPDQAAIERMTARLHAVAKDQLALRAKVVPAPPSVLLAGLALGGLAFRRVLRRPTAV